ncbi:MAG: pyrimidine reductase, partial [Caldilineae bacterium]
MDQLQQLFPQVGPAPFPGAYLAHDLRHASRHPGRPFVYANFVVSLDGRIAVPAADGQGLIVPKQIANERDWRLYQELAAQADLIISSGRYLRDWAAGRAQEIL